MQPSFSQICWTAQVYSTWPTVTHRPLFLKQIGQVAAILDKDCKIVIERILCPFLLSKTEVLLQACTFSKLVN